MAMVPIHTHTLSCLSQSKQTERKNDLNLFVFCFLFLSYLLHQSHVKRALNRVACKFAHRTIRQLKLISGKGREKLLIIEGRQAGRTHSFQFIFTYIEISLNAKGFECILSIT